jgi:hypothetical protein
VPLNDLGTGSYLNQFQGGLYPNGSNVVPALHSSVGRSRALNVGPLDTLGQPDPNGKYVLLSIGMSNTTQEFCSPNSELPPTSWSFMGQAFANPVVNHTTVAMVNGAQGGKAASFWDSPTDPDYDRVRDTRLAPQGLSEQQVRAVWLKVANPNPTVRLPNANADAYVLEQQMGNIARALKVRYPNLDAIFVSSRIYAGYASSTLNPEPYAYESGLAVKWLIEAQINQMNGSGIDSRAGDLNYSNGTSPWIAWGPYMWADGTNPRSDGLTWVQSDFASDGTHPSQQGQQKVGAMLLNFMMRSPYSQPWFTSPLPGDANLDARVNIQDFNLLATNYNQVGKSWTEGDFNYDGRVNVLDFNLLASHFNQTQTVSGTTPVPQPCAGSILIIGTGWLSSARRSVRDSRPRNF